jgi:hypothetical protein
MVTITGYTKRQNAEGKEFYTLSLMGGVTLVKSSKTGNYYATAWKSSISSTFDEDVCKSLIGTKLQGIVTKVESDPYEYKIPSTGETVMLTHKYRFDASPNTATMEEVVFTPEPQLA